MSGNRRGGGGAGVELDIGVNPVAESGGELAEEIDLFF